MRTRVLLLALLAIAPLLRAQHGEQISVRVVTIPVLAHDERGRPVTDLQAADLTVREGNRTYRVASLARYLDQPPSRTELPRVRLITQLDGGRAAVASTAAAEPRYMVVVIDLENDPPVERKRMTDALKHFLANELDPSFQVALLLFDGEVRQLVPLTQERRAVVDALDRVHSERAARARLAPGTLMQELLVKLTLCGELEAESLVQCLRDTAYEYSGEITQRAHAFVDAMESVVGYVEGLEGHKSILVVGGNLSLNPAREVAEAVRAIYGYSDDVTEFEQSLQGEEAVRPRLNDLWARAFRNRVSISFLDRTPAPSDVSARIRGAFEPGFRPMTTAHQAGQQDLNEIAAATGGSFVASTRVDEGLRQSLVQMRSAYELSIHLPDDEPLTPRRLRRISIKTKRPGVRVTHQRGFEGARAEEQIASLRGSIETGEPVPHELDGATIDVVPLHFVLDPADLGYEEKGKQTGAQFTVHLRLRTPDGGLLADTYRVLTHTGDAPVLTAYADVPPGEYVAEAVVTVPRLEKRGVLRRAFTRAAPAVVAENVPAVAPAASVAPVASIPTPATRTEPLREHRPTIAFARHFLGIVSGNVDVRMIAGREIASVELQLDGNPITTIDRAPWTHSLSLGDAPSPRELVAIGRDASGRELGRARQWLNLPRPWTELEVVLSDAGDGTLQGQIALESAGGEKPRQLTVTLDGTIVSLSNSPKFRLPAVDMTNIHLLRVDAEFEKAGVVSRDVVIGGRYVQEASAELSSVAVQLPRDSAALPEDVRISAGGRPVSVVALEKGPADVIVVLDPRAIRLLPGITVTGNRTALLPNADVLLTPAGENVRLRLLWPIAQGGGDSPQLGYRLFPSTDPDAVYAGGFLWQVAAAAFPEGEGPVRLTDAVAVAGPMAIERGRRRAVLLILGGSRTEGQYTAAAVRAYLEQLHVPLIVWSIGPPTRAILDDWGRVEVVANRLGLRNAWTNLTRRLDRQRVAWIEGMHLPQTLEVAVK